MLDAFSVICCALHHHFCMNFKLELDVHCQKDKRHFLQMNFGEKKKLFFYSIFNVLLICAKKNHIIFNVLLQSTTNSPKY
jgi:hypothetical protein